MERKKKKILYFVGLKIIEVIGILLLFSISFYIGRCILSFLNSPLEGVLYIGLTFCFGICFIMVVGMILWLLYIVSEWWIESNWKWADKLSRRK